MADCKTCKRIDVKCCPTCGRGNDCDVYHKCGEDCIGFKPKTNADRIRSMTDEELAEWLGTNIYNSGENIIDCDNPPTVYCCDDCKKCYLIWLKEVVEK